MTELLLINPEDAKENEVASWPVREAARAVVFDTNNKIALLHVVNKNYYKLPGGGIEASETREAALKRECIEEIGCDVEILGEIGCTTEYRKYETLKQISYCYIVRVTGKQQAPALSDDELADGFRPVWISYEEAARLMRESIATDFEGKTYIVPRDTLLLTKVESVILDHKRAFGILTP